MLTSYLSWKQAIFYEIFVQSFADSNSDGIGDLKGLTYRLDYLKSLGINAIWLMPIHPSPSYHKYDVTDYYSIHPSYGTLEDFKHLVSEIHKREMKIVIDLVLNHTSDEHPWFLEAKKGKENTYRDYYVWMDENDIQEDDPEFHWHFPRDVNGKVIKGEKYYGVFWHKMPDLNISNPQVQQELIKIGRYWIEEMQVDGFRLDAAKFVIREDQPKKNHAWWQYFASKMRKIKPNVFLVGEVWDGPEVIAPYLKDGFDACFNFQLGDLILRTVNARKDKYDLVGAFQWIQEQYNEHSNKYFDATFITNHDLARVGSVVKKSIHRMKMAASLLLSLPGIPFIYYGEEIGMLGKKPDEYIREPFLWGAESENSQTSWVIPMHSNPQTVIPLSNQQKNKRSLLNHYKKWIKFRNTHLIMSVGEIETCTSIDVSGILAFYRVYEGKKWLIIHNLRGRRKHINIELTYTKILFYTHESLITADGIMELSAFSSIVIDTYSLTYKKTTE